MSEMPAKPVRDPYHRGEYIPEVAEYLQTLRPAQIVAAFRSSDEQYKGRRLSEVSEQEKQLKSAVFSVIEWLPELNAPLAREVYQTLCESPDEEERIAGRTFVSAMTPFDHDFGLALWRNLMRDTSRTVRDHAEEELDFIPEDHSKVVLSGADLKRLDRLGITYDEAYELLEIRDEAERTGRFYDLGATVLRRVGDILWGPPQEDSAAPPSP